MRYQSKGTKDIYNMNQERQGGGPDSRQLHQEATGQLQEIEVAMLRGMKLAMGEGPDKKQQDQDQENGETIDLLNWDNEGRNEDGIRQRGWCSSRLITWEEVKYCLKAASVRNWTLFYLIICIFPLFFSSAQVGGILLRGFAGLILVVNITDFALITRRRFCARTLPSTSNNRNTSTHRTFVSARWYVIGLSALQIWCPGVYPSMYFFFRPSPTMERVLSQLQYDIPSYNASSMSYDDRRHPMQALYMENGYARKLSHALQVHFDRVGRNETKQFEYVKQLNLIGNIFNDDGADAILEALRHPFAYTNWLLLGGNTNIGDRTAIDLSALIKQSEHKSLLSLELGSTSVTEKGLGALYHAMEMRPFSFLELGYMDPSPRLSRYLLPPSLYSRISSVAKSLKNLHEAKHLQQLVFTGNGLGDMDMSILADNVQQTNITELGLINNHIGTAGVSHLIPLTRQLKYLNLGINRRIGDRAAITLADALKHPNSTIETLSLFNCNIGKAGGEALLSIFPQNKNIKMLFVDGNKIDKETIQKLRAATEANY